MPETMQRIPIVIIGAGFGGIAMAMALRRAGEADFVILERAADVGGVWRDNSYPGAACDVVSRMYSFSFDQGYTWSSAFAPQPEIFAYIRGVVERHDLRRFIRFNTEVASARFDQGAARWRLETTAGVAIETPVLISAVGLFNRVKIPDFPGRDSFKGVQFHSAAWRHDLDLAGKTVAVVGNGASAVQFIPKIAPLVKQLYLFQRTPQYVLPKRIFPGTSDWDAKMQRVPWLRGLTRLKIFLGYERFVFRRKWRPAARMRGEAAYRAMVAAKVKDPALRAKLIPNYPIGCKRQLASDEWLDTLVRPNVEVVDTRIAAVTEHGIRTADGTERAVDTIIYGTGFTPTEYLQPMTVTGLGGRDINQAWREGAEAYLGITVPGFPNFFMLYGPNTNAITSIIYMLECQARYITDCIRALRARGAGYMTVREEPHRSFVAMLQRRIAPTVQAMSICLTYYKNEFGRVTTNWPGYAFEYRWRTRSVRPRDYDFVGRTP